MCSSDLKYKTNISEIIENNLYNNKQIIDIGCGFKTQKYANKLKSNFIGIDSDFSIINSLKIK